MRVTFITLYPEAFPGTLAVSILARALEQEQWSYRVINLRDYAIGKHAQVDAPPYGGGAGMLMRADVLGPAIEAALAEDTEARVVYLSPRGVPFTQEIASSLSKTRSLILICGRFEGIDQRVIDHYGIEELSIGDYVLLGGEVAAQVVAEATLRLIPGILGADESAEEESFALKGDYAGLLEYPHYTKPPLWKDLTVPEVLRSGHHENIKKWRKKQAEGLTQARRTDMWRRYKEKEARDEPVTNH